MSQKEPTARSAPLSNAERQRRWRERLKAKASGAAVTDHARDVVAHAIAALWAYHERPGPGGTRWAEIDGCRTIEDYVADLAAEESGLIAAARAFLPAFEGLTPEEARAITALIDLADVLALRGERGQGVLARLLAAPTQGSARQSGKRRAGDSRLALVQNPVSDLAGQVVPEQQATAPAEAPDPAGDQVIRLTAARRARRRARLGKWK